MTTHTHPTNTNETIFGTKYDDVLEGSAGLNIYIYGLEGNDILLGGDGHNIIYGGKDNDIILGGKYSDSLLGEEGDDNIFGKGGNDTILGGDGNDKIDGGEDNDRIAGGKGDNQLKGGDGEDTFILSGSALGGKDEILDFELGEDKLQFIDISKEGVQITFNGEHTILHVKNLAGDTQEVQIDNVNLLNGASQTDALQQLIDQGTVQFLSAAEALQQFMEQTSNPVV